MKRLSSLILLTGFLCMLLSACTPGATPFLHTLKAGRYQTDEAFVVGDMEITHFEIELSTGDLGQYIQTNGNNMIKDLSTINQKSAAVFRSSISMCINGETETFRFDKAEALTPGTATEYKVSGLRPAFYGSEKSYPTPDDFIMTTVDDDGDGIAEKLRIQMGDAVFTLENTDVLYHFTLEDEEGIFGTQGTRKLTYFDYQTVTLHDYDVDTTTTPVWMPIITLSTGEVITPVLEESDNIGRYWLISFPMPGEDIGGTVQVIEADMSFLP